MNDNPFYAGTTGKHAYFHLSADDRIRCVQDFTAEQCEQALRVPDLQATVRKAIERRQRKLEKAGH